MGDFDCKRFYKGRATKWQRIVSHFPWRTCMNFFHETLGKEWYLRCQLETLGIVGQFLLTSPSEKSSNPLNLMILVFNGKWCYCFHKNKGKGSGRCQHRKIKMLWDPWWKLNKGRQAWVVSLVVSYHGNHNQWFLVFDEKWNWLGRCQNRNIWVLWGGSCI